MSDDEASKNFLVSEAQLLAEKARREKSERFKTIGDPIELLGKALAIEVKGNHAWIGESTAVVKKLDLETGKVLQVYKGHFGPVTAIAFYDKVEGSGDQKILISGSWDRSIKLWNTNNRQLISSTSDAHNDFVKSFLVIPSLKLLVSGGSDKIVRFWDLSTIQQDKSLQNAGSISSHTRPIGCLAGYVTSPTSAILYTADTMGVLKIWELRREQGIEPALWKASPKGELGHHRTRINDLALGQNLIWSASSDDTVQIHPAIENDTVAPPKVPKPLVHPVAVKGILPLPLTELGESYLLTIAGDFLRVYDVSTLEEPELVSTTDVHWHSATAIRLWFRHTKSEAGSTQVEPYIVTTSLDQSIRKWRLADLLMPTPPPALVAELPKEEEVKLDKATESELTEEEERELAEMMGDSD